MTDRDVPAAGPPASATARRHVHPATIGVYALQTVPVLGLAYFLLVDPDARGAAGWLIAGLVLATAAALTGAYFAWRRLTYFFDESGDFRLDSGVVYRKERRLALSRLQSVDIVRPLLARLIGMASVRIEVAGAGESTAVVEYLPLRSAEALRAEVLARAAGSGPDAVDAVEAPEEIQLTVPAGVLMASLLLRGSTVIAILLTILGVAGIVAFTGPAGFLVLGFGVFVPVLTVLGEFASFFNFTVARSSDGLRIRAGLLATTAQTVPPGRVHAVEFTQSFLWRRVDWVRVNLNIAGTGLDVQGEGRGMPKVLVPVATTHQARALVAQLLPDWEIAAVALVPAPPAARRRAWIQHRRLGFGWDGHILVTSRGRFVRRTAAVAHARVQSVKVVQGPWQRRLGLATVRADTVPGPVQVAALHLDAEQARQLADGEIRLMHAAAQSDPPLRRARDIAEIGEGDQ